VRPLARAAAVAPSPPASAGTPEHPTIINRPNPPEDHARSAKEPPPNAEGAAKFSTSALKEAAVHIPPAPARDGADANRSIEVSIINTVGSPAMMLVGLAMVALFTAGTFVWLRNHERASRAGAGSREFASASLAAAQTALTPSARVQPAGRSEPAPVQYGPKPALDPTSMPRNRPEALTILGMGVSPDATQVAIKRIVDGLRLSWHPDHAKDDDDRQVRELRLKQINAAWEILNGTRPEA